jgi:hypothetical protein
MNLAEQTHRVRRLHQALPPDERDLALLDLTTHGQCAAASFHVEKPEPANDEPVGEARTCTP